MLTMIKIKPITVVLICFVILQSKAQEISLETKIKQVKQTVSALLAVKKWDSVISKPLSESTEGGEARYYYQNKNLKKIIHYQFGETYKAVTEYYLKKEKAVFIYELLYRYNRPITWDSIVMKENKDDDQVWDLKKVKRYEKRNYFYNNQLIKQIITTPESTREVTTNLNDQRNIILAGFSKLLAIPTNPLQEEKQ